MEGGKHSCKVCGRSFHCGRSLGGHMRSHMSLSSSLEAEEKPQSSRSSVPFGAVYGLRENPKKTWRFSGAGGDDDGPKRDKLCKECGRGFPSWKSLFGHMRCHSERSHHALEEQEETEEEEEEEEEEDEEEAGEQEQERELEKREGSSSARLVLESHSDNEVVVPRRRRRSRLVASIPASSSSPASELEKEQEDVALSLMMLSRDAAGFWAGTFAESSDKNSVVLEDTGAGGAMDGDEGNEVQRSELGAPTDGYPTDGYRTNGQKKEESDASYDGFVRIDGFKTPKARSPDDTDGFFGHADEASRKESLKSKNPGCGAIESEKRTRFDQWRHPGIKKCLTIKKEGFDTCHAKLGTKRSRYECATCNKTFHSYQALGGHRASHKRIRGCFASRADGSDNSLETDASIDPALVMEEAIDQSATAAASCGAAPKRANAHECPICNRVFSSGQALGGHKRSHLVVSSEGGAVAACHQTIVLQPPPPPPAAVMPDLLDLNLPAPVDGDTNNSDGNVEFKAWWIRSNHEHEPLVV